MKASTFKARLLGFVLGLTLVSNSAFASEELLLGITGAGNTLSSAYLVDTVTGDAQLLGQLTHNGVNLRAVASAALSPIDGFVYLVNNTNWSDDDEGKALYRISANDLVAGITSVELVADLSGLDLGQTPDATFRSDGRFYVWSEDSDDAVFIDVETGDITKIASDIGTYATGVAFDEEGRFWVKSGDQLNWIDFSSDGTSSLDEESSYGEIDVGVNGSNMLSLGSDGYFWSGYRDGDNTILFKFLPAAGDISASTIATVSDVKFAALEWVVASRGKDTAFWNSVENCRLSMARSLSAGSDVSTSTYQSCFFTGVNSSNAAAVNSALKDQLARAAASGTAMSHADLMKAAAQIADRLDLIQRLSTGKLVYAAEFAEVGIDLGANPTRTLDTLQGMESKDIDTLDELLAQIRKVA